MFLNSKNMTRKFLKFTMKFVHGIGTTLYETLHTITFLKFEQNKWVGFRSFSIALKFYQCCTKLFDFNFNVAFQHYGLKEMFHDNKIFLNNY